MTFWQRLFHPSSPAPDAGQRFSQLVTTVLHQQRLMGEVLLQLPHQFNHHFPSVMGLAWDHGRLVIVVNPAKLIQLRQDDAALLLMHLALHVVWGHPARYAHYPDQDLVTLATDIAVNQYLPAVPVGTASLAQLRRVLRQPILEKLDSQEYLRIIKDATQEEQDKLRRAAGGSQTGRRFSNDSAAPAESHAGWTVADVRIAGDQAGRLAAIRHIIRQAWRQTPQRDRGLLPGEVRARLEQQGRVSVKLPAWQQLFRRQLGKVAQGKLPRANRFNRRQPLRMDLPGQVSRLVPAVYVFVDNSGSVPDDELATALQMIGQMTVAFDLPVWVYSFDAKVHGNGKRLRPGQTPAFVRRGGGGTRFQAVFDFLRDHRVPKTGSLIVIITDGWGESTLRGHRYRNVDWFLTTKREQLSVQAPASHIFELRRE